MVITDVGLTPSIDRGTHLLRTVREQRDPGVREAPPHAVRVKRDPQRGRGGFVEGANLVGMPPCPFAISALWRDLATRPESTDLPGKIRETPGDNPGGAVRPKCIAPSTLRIFRVE